MLGTPIFICGHAKSGTTLLAALLDNHSEVAVFPEETFYLRQVGNNPDRTTSELAEWLLAQIARKQPSDDGREVYDQWSFAYFKDLELLGRRFRTFLENSPDSCGGLLELLVSTYAEETGQVGRRYWLEKTHGNEMFLDMALQWHPEMRSIYIVRDPRDVYVSWSRRMRASDKSDNIENFLYRWGMSVWAWRQFLAGHDGLTIRYEDLLRYPTETMTFVCRFLGIGYEDSLEKPTKNGRLWLGNSMHGNTFTGISTKPIGRWREKLSKEHLELIEGYLGKAMLSFGYRLSMEPLSFHEAARLWFRLNGKNKQLLGMLTRLYWPFRIPKRLRRGA
jgi:hypothetical protein